MGKDLDRPKSLGTTCKNLCFFIFKIATRIHVEIAINEKYDEKIIAGDLIIFDKQ